MAHFSPDMKGRYWFGTIQKKNLLNLGIKEEEFNDYPYVSEVVTNAWSYSGKGRTLAGVICNSANDLLHLHVVAYTFNSTTLRSVSKYLGSAHIEPVLAGKKEQIENYLLKKPPWDEKGEEILYSFGLENIIEPKQGNRTDLDDIKLMIQDGATPNAIFQKDIRYLRYEKMVLRAYTDKRISEAPLEKNMDCKWHWGRGRTGKSHEYIELCKKYGRENIYFLTDFQNGGLDMYMQKGAPRILFVDDVKPEDMRYRQLLMLTDRYSDAQTHSRYSNALNLWEEVHITSVYPIEEYYKAVVSEERRKVDTFDQLIGRFNTIVYHFIGIDDDFKSFSMSARNYVSANDMKSKAWQSQYKIPLPSELTKEEIKEYKERGLII